MNKEKVIIRRQDRINYVLDGLCSYWEISREEMKSYRRNPQKHDRKRIAIKLLYDIADITFQEIALNFDRTSGNAVWQTYQNISADLQESSYGNKELKQEYKNILKYLGV